MHNYSGYKYAGSVDYLPDGREQYKIKMRRSLSALKRQQLR